MARPMRSLTDPPGLRLSTLATNGVRVLAARRERRTNGVLPTASRIVSRISAGMALHRSIRLFHLAILAASVPNRARSRASDARRQQAARLVRREQTRLALAPVARSVRDPGRRRDAGADTGRSGDPQMARLAGP